MLYSIRDDNGLGFECQMVAQNLIEDRFAQRHIVSFALDHEQSFSLTIVADDIRPPLHAVQVQWVLHRNEAKRIVQIVRKVMQPMLSDPLFRFECNKFFPTQTFDVISLVRCPEIGSKGRKV